MSRDGHRDWYPGPQENDPCWPALKRWLLEQKGWDPVVVDDIDRASTKVVSQLDAPGEREFNTRGLVLGYVQSGETANFTAVTAKAADAGYRLFIVLSGLHNGLRRQTQERLERELVQLSPELWHCLTSVEEDFQAPGNATAYLSERSTQRVLCVMKKNAPRLRRLLRWLRTADRQVLEGCPVLMIDDEADQASVDTNGTEDPSVINGLILNVLRQFPRSAYLGYTATPFANILSDTSSRELLYPTDFIVDLPQPEAYFGAARLFGTGVVDHDTGEQDDGLDVIRMVPEADVGLLTPASLREKDGFDPEVGSSLEQALRWFWLACAVRRLRGQADSHMSMLVHSTMLTLIHQRIGERIGERLRQLQLLVQREEAGLRKELEAQWNDEIGRAASEAPDASSPSFADVWKMLPGVLRDCRVVVENGRSQERLEFPEKGGSCQIIVGGNTLSRGLTIEGLMVSYFVRSSRTYDTLLQMGRWFGYRIGYGDLPRIWMTAELQDSFQHLARVEEEIREHIERYEREGCTPADFAPHIQTHSTLAVTSQMKMQYAVTVRMSFDEGVKQTTYLNHRDLEWVHGNTRAAKALLRAAHRLHPPEMVWGRHLLYRDVPTQEVLEFLKDYRIHERHGDMPADQLRNWIGAQNGDGRLLRWNLGVVTRGASSLGPEWQWTGLLPNDQPVTLINRAKLKGTSPANVKAIMGKVDRTLDFGFETPPRTAPNDYDGSFVSWTKDHRSPPDDHVADPNTGRNTPLLLSYPIAAHSDLERSNNRERLDAVDHIIGLAMIFPRSPHLTPQSYITADLSRNLDEEDALDWYAELGGEE